MSDITKPAGHLAGDLTDADLDAIEQRANAATEGPWESGDDDWDGGYVRMPADGFGVAYIATHIQQGADEGCADAEFIAHARGDVPVLLAEVRRLRAMEQRVREYARSIRYLDGKHYAISIYEALGGGDHE